MPAAAPGTGLAPQGTGRARPPPLACARKVRVQQSGSRTPHRDPRPVQLLLLDADFADVIAVGFELDLLESLYAEVAPLSTFRCDRCMARENGLVIVRARKPRVTNEEIRTAIKRFYFF